MFAGRDAAQKDDDFIVDAVSPSEVMLKDSSLSVQEL